MLPLDNKKENCTGCTACTAYCHCLTMVLDAEGFRYPQVDLTECSRCGKCLTVCPMVSDSGAVLAHPGSFVKDTAAPDSFPLVFAAWNNDDSVRRNSSSGGVFTLLAQHVIESGGIVFGAAFDDRLRLHHRSVETNDDLPVLRGAKYLQSDMGDSIDRVKEMLRIGRQVLFSGTPCQVAGLKSVVGKSSELLLTCDLVCHGVPSDKLFLRYVDELEASHGTTVTVISFRNKRSGWKRYRVKVEFANGTVYEKLADKDSFMRLFLSDICLRPSCYYCPFSAIPRQGDITLADYWGVAAAHSGIDDDRGISLVLANSLRGSKAFESISDKMTFIPSDLAIALSGNPCLIRPVPVNPRRHLFMEDLESCSTKALCNKYLGSVSRNWRYYVSRTRILNYLKNL